MNTKEISENLKMAECLKQFVLSIISSEELRTSLLMDNKFTNELSDIIIERMVSQGILEDKLLSIEETMKLLGITSRNTLKSMANRGLLPVRLAKNSHPKYKLSEINRYISNLKLSL